MNAKMNIMDLQGDIKWIQNELNNVKDPKIIETFKKLLKNRRKVSEPSYELTAEQKAILDQRLEDHKANPESGRSWSAVKSDLRAKYGV